MPSDTKTVRGRGVTHKSQKTERGRGLGVTNLVYGFLIALRDGRTKEKKAEKKKEMRACRRSELVSAAAAARVGGRRTHGGSAGSGRITALLLFGSGLLIGSWRRYFLLGET